MHSFLFPQCFQKLFFSGIVESLDCVVKGCVICKSHQIFTVPVNSQGLNLIVNLSLLSTTEGLLSAYSILFLFVVVEEFSEKKKEDFFFSYIKHTSVTFHDLRKELFLKHCGKRIKWL